MMDLWMDACTLVMVSALYGSSVAELPLHSIIATCNSNSATLDPFIANIVMKKYTFIHISIIKHVPSHNN